MLRTPPKLPSCQMVSPPQALGHGEHSSRQSGQVMLRQAGLCLELPHFGQTMKVLGGRAPLLK